MTYRILSIPVDGDAPYSFVFPASVADHAQRKARKMGRTLEGYLLAVFRGNLKTPVSAALDEVERGHARWKHEFERRPRPGESLRIIIDVPALHADYLRRKLLLRGTSIGEHVMDQLNRSIVAFETHYGEPEVRGQMK